MANVPKRNRDFPNLSYFIPVVLVANVPKRNRDDTSNAGIPWVVEVANVPKRNRDDYSFVVLETFNRWLMYLRGIETSFNTC